MGRVLKYSADAPQPALVRLEAAKGAAWLIEIGRGRLIASNTAGSEFLGVPAASPMLDAAMPALLELRRLWFAADAEHRTVRQRLVFWTPRGVLAPICEVALLSEGGIDLALVTREGEPRTHSLQPPEGEDASALKEIARRIREGQAARLPVRRSDADGLRDRASTHSDSQMSPETGAGAERKPAELQVPVSLRAQLAHELRAPASAISAAAEIMRDERFGPIGNARYASYAADIHNSAAHMLALIERILADGARDGVPHQASYTFAELDLADILTSSMSQLAHLAERAGISLSLAIDKKLPHLIADATSVRQILINLVTNALKFTPRDGAITVDARQQQDGTLVLDVSDTGSGMTQEIIASVLDPRSATHGKPATAGGGLGLGLPLVQALALANGGVFTISSDAGKGTVARVVFDKTRVVPV